MGIVNLTHPGKDPVRGDKVEITHQSGAVEKKVYAGPHDVSAGGEVETISGHKVWDTFSTAEQENLMGSDHRKAKRLIMLIQMNKTLPKADYHYCLQDMGQLKLISIERSKQYEE